MPTKVTNRRGETRGEIPDFQDAEIELNLPDGSRRTLPLGGLSVNGGSFHLAKRVRGLDVGTTIHGAVIRIGELEIKVHMEVRHVTRTGNEYDCGGRFFPMSDDDRNEMAGLIARLRSLPS
jgi:hypothetical protein